MVEDRMLSKITSVQLLSLPFDFVLGVFARAKCEEKKIKGIRIEEEKINCLYSRMTLSSMPKILRIYQKEEKKKPSRTN